MFFRYIFLKAGNTPFVDFYRSPFSEGKNSVRAEYGVIGGDQIPAFPIAVRMYEVRFGNGIFSVLFD